MAGTRIAIDAAKEFSLIKRDACGTASSRGGPPGVYTFEVPGEVRTVLSQAVLHGAAICPAPLRHGRDLLAVHACSAALLHVPETR